jgi:hypothetical protein
MATGITILIQMQVGHDPLVFRPTKTAPVQFLVIVIPTPALPARNLLSASSETADSPRDNPRSE